MAYLQMDKNEKRNLKTDEDFEAFALSTYNEANEYFELTTYAYLPLFYKCPTAIYMNAAFTCELFLKSLHYHFNHTPCYTHKLDDLFKKLPENVQSRIITTSKLTSKDFKLGIKEIRCAFEVLRYASERTELAWDGRFIMNLLTVLKAYCNYLFKKQ